MSSVWVAVQDSRRTADEMHRDVSCLSSGHDLFNAGEFFNLVGTKRVTCRRQCQERVHVCELQIREVS